MKKKARKPPPRRRRATPKVPDPPAEPTLPPGLNEAQHAFCLEYLANGFNASAAYKAAYGVDHDPTARTNGHRLLTNADVKAFVARQLEQRWTAAQMSADEALALVASDARADVRVLYDEKGKLLPVQDWPDAIACSVESIEEKPDGSFKVKLTSKLAARRMILEVHRRLKAPGESDTADALAALLARHYKPEP